MVKKLTDKQKSRLWQQLRSQAFQASSKLDDIDVPLISLTADEVAMRINVLRGKHAQ